MSVIEVRHSPGCQYEKLTKERDDLLAKDGRSKKETVRCFEISTKLDKLIVDGCCTDCGINQITLEKSKDRRGAFA